MGIVDPYSEEEYWETLKHGKIQRTIDSKELGSVNSPPEVPYLKVVCISDTHEQLGDLKDIPDGDVLIHAGDFTNAGDKEQLEEFNRIIGTFPHRHKLVVAGNHELGFDAEEDLDSRDSLWIGRGTSQGHSIITNAKWLHDESVTIEGVKFYGASWHPLAGYPFYKRRKDQLVHCWKRIPTDTDVLITHTPPLGYLDVFGGTERWGCRDLLKEVEERVKPKFHVFGHVHDCYGSCSNDTTIFINAALCSNKNKLQNRPLVFYIPTKDT